MCGENHRYDAVYVVDRPALLAQLATYISVLHLGQVEAVDAVVKAIPARWFIVSLWCPRHIVVARIEKRGIGDAHARLRAWDETAPLSMADLTINTANITPDDTAYEIHCRLGQARH